MKNAVKRPKDQLERINPESSWLNSGIKTLDQLKSWILIKLGAPTQTVELSPEQLDVSIHDSISLYSKYAYTPEKYLTLNLKFYKPGVGIDLSEFKVMSVKSLSVPRDNVMGQYGDMFFGPYSFFGQGQGFPFFNNGMGNYVGAWTTYQCMTEFFQLSKEMMGNNPDFVYDKQTQHLRLMPEPRHGMQNQFVLITCNVEPPMEEYFGNEYCRRLILAEAKILLGTIRKKFQNISLVGGGSVDTSIGDEGREEKQAALEDIIKSESKGQCCFIV